MADPLPPVRVGFGGEDEPFVVHTEAELDAALDTLDRRAREAGDLVIALLEEEGLEPIDALESGLSIGVGADLVPLTYEYVHSVGDLPEGDAEVWHYLNSWDEVSPTWLVPVDVAREAARRWFATRQEPDNVEWET